MTPRICLRAAAALALSVGLGVGATLASPANAAFLGDPIFDDDFESGGTCAWGFGTSTCPGFQVQTPAIAVAAGEEIYVCYYFHTPNAATLAIRRWASTMSAGVEHLILYSTHNTAWAPVDRQPPGTVTQAPCGLNEGGGYDGWLYAAHEPEEELIVPPDDGSGTPLAVEIAAGTPAYIQLRLYNGGGETIQTSVTVGGEALPAAAPYTQTATYLASHFMLSLPTGQQTRQESCSTPPGAEFWWLSTHTNRLGTGAKILDGGSPVVETTGWLAPSATYLTAPNFLAFSANSLTYECSWDNTTGGTVTNGDDELTKEACFGIGYFFPATRPTICSTNGAPL